MSGIWELMFRLNHPMVADELDRRAFQGRMALMRARRAARRLQKPDPRVEELEGDVARLALMVVTLSEVVVRKGLMTREELTALTREIDLLDGEEDGALDPAQLRPEPEPEPAPPPPAVDVALARARARAKRPRS